MCGLTDASDYTIGGMLMQQGRSIAFESRKLSDTKRHYSVHEKEMTAAMHFLSVATLLAWSTFCGVHR